MKVTRRGFLAGVAGSTVAAAGTARAGGIEYFPGHPGRMGLLHDTTLCVGCRSCEAACNAVNGLPPPAKPVGDTSVFKEKRRNDDELYTVVNRYREATGNQPAVFRKHQCMHCNEPCCASVCFVKAFVKTPEGPVLYDPELCVGCRYCVFACPYYALAYEYKDPLTPRVVRCTMCYDRIVKGQNPSCADACPTGAIVFGERDKIVHVARERMRKYPGRYIDFLFGEHEYGGTSWLTLSGIPLRELDLPENVTHDPLPNLTTRFLSVAPLVAAIFPGLLAGFYAFTRSRKRQNERDRQAEAARLRAQFAKEMDEKLAAAETQAERDKVRTVERAVRSALREAAQQAAAEAAPAKKPAKKPKPKGDKAVAAPDDKTAKKAEPEGGKEDSSEPTS